MTPEQRTIKIRELNDDLRTNYEPWKGEVFVTSGAFASFNLAEVIKRVKTYDSFDEDNDPYGEHDFGAFDYRENRFFWKIEYYDKAREFGSPNPADPSVTHRVLTIMLASEY